MKMKKIVMMLAMAAFVVSFAACGGKTTQTTTEESTTLTEETVTPASAEGDVLAKYEELVNKAIDLYPKVLEGDANATQSYGEIALEISKISQDVSTALATASPEQQQRIAELGRKFAEAAPQVTGQ
jgi:ABC-type Fe3+-hydroxamate transport system substrate-binding protein